jgi:hypothetical protein
MPPHCRHYCHTLLITPLMLLTLHADATCHVTCHYEPMPHAYVTCFDVAICH